MIITSAVNEKIAHAAKLLDKKYRKRYSQYLIEGARLLTDALVHGADVAEIFVKQSVADKFAFEGQIAVADGVFAKLSDTVNSQGVVAVVNCAPDALSAPQGNCLVLDGLQDPGNLGTLIRTAAACGFTDIYAVNCVDAYSPKVLRSAMSAHFCLNICQCNALAPVLDVLRRAGVTVVAADMGGDNVFDCRFGTPVALVLGNEGNGLSDEARRGADLTVSLPMRSNGVESLNVSVAGSVIMYQIYSQTLLN